MALEFVGAAEASGSSSPYTLVISTLVGGSDISAKQGDIVIVLNACVSLANIDVGVDTGGFAELADLYANDTRDANLAASWKIMSAAVDTAVICKGSTSAGNASVSVAHVWRGVDQSNPIDCTTTTSTGTSSSNINSPPITVSTYNAVILSGGVGTSAAVDNSITCPTTFTHQVDISYDPGNAATVGLSARRKIMAGVSVNPDAWTGITTSTSDSWCAVTIALRPEPQYAGRGFGRGMARGIGR